MYLSSMERICNFFNKKKNEKASKQPMKTSTKQTHTFGLRLKHVNKQVAFKCKFEFGVWGKSKSVKMRVFIIFKGKMHFSWHIYEQVCNIKLKYATK